MATSILIADDVKEKMLNLFPKNVTCKDENADLGIVLYLKKSVYTKLNELSLGDKRIEYTSSLEFKNGIKGFAKVNLYKDNIISFFYDTFNPVPVKEILFVLPANAEVYVVTPVSDTIAQKELIVNGFCSPFITPYTICEKEYPSGIAMLRGKKRDCASVESTLEEIRHLIGLSSSSESTCDLHARLTKDTVDYLKTTSKIGMTNVGSNKSTQKELAGELYVKEVKTGGYEIDVNLSSVIGGELESVSVTPSRYNFHSHPHDAYLKNKVKKAWPSVVDYLGFLNLGNATIFHCVATLEGVYVMSFTAEWVNRLSEVSKKFVDKKFDISHKSKMTPEEYVKKVNAILYKGHPIYHIVFMPWNQATKPFKIFFAPTGASCITSQKTLNAQKKSPFGKKKK